MGQAEYVTDLVKRDGLHVESARNRTDDPVVLGVVEVDGLRRASGHHPAPGWEVRLCQDAADHGEVRVIYVAPVDGDVWILVEGDSAKFFNEDRALFQSRQSLG